MDSPDVLAGPEAAPTSQPVPLDSTLTPRSSPSSTSLSPTSTASTVVFLLLFGLAALVFAICWSRRQRITSEVSDKRPLEKAEVRDVEALAETRPIVPVAPILEVRWTPQIRSISGPMLDKSSHRIFAAPPPKRARSPPPSVKTQNPWPNPYTKSAPAHAQSFSQNEIPRLSKSSRETTSPPVTPHALAVSGMETRSLGRPGVGLES